MLPEGEEDWQTLDVRRFILYGGSATLAIDTLLYPLELVKTKLQVDPKARGNILSAFLASAKDTYKAEGPPGFYRGFLLFTLGGLPSQGVYFLGYNYVKDKLLHWNQRQQLDALRIPEEVVPMVAGLAADVLAAPLWTPADVIASRLQIQGMAGAMKYRGAWHALQHILQVEGVRGLFRGLGISIGTFGPASAVWWGVYEQTDKSLHAWLQRRGVYSDTAGGTKVWWVAAAAGMVAGAVSSLLTNPLDIAKTRLQTQHSMIVDYEQQQEKQHREKLEREVMQKHQRRLNFFIALKAFREKQRNAAVSAAFAAFTKPKAQSAGTAAGPGAAAPTKAPAAPPLSPPSAVPRHGTTPPARLHAPSLGITPYQATLSRNTGILRSIAVATRAAIRLFEFERVGRRRKAPTSTSHLVPPKSFYPVIARKFNTSMWSILKHMWVHEGPASLLKGIVPRISFSALASACTFLAYEQVKQVSRKSPAPNGEVMR